MVFVFYFYVSRYGDKLVCLFEKVTLWTNIAMGICFRMHFIYSTFYVKLQLQKYLSAQKITQESYRCF